MSEPIEVVPTQPNNVPPNGAPPPAIIPVEAPVETVPAEAKPNVQDQRMAERFALLARRERAVVERQQAATRELAARQAALKQEAEALAAERARYQEMTQRIESAKTDPAGLLKSLYGDDWYDRLTKYQLSGGEAPPAEMQVQQIREELAKSTEELKAQQASLQEKIDAERKASIERERDRLAAEASEEIQRFESESIDFVKQNASKYELTNLYENQGLVPLLIRETYEASAKNGTPRILSPEEAADVVEKYLSDEVEKAERLRQRKAQAAQAVPQPASSAKPTAPTLTNGMGGAPALETTHRTFSLDERLARANAAWEAAEAARRK